MNAAYLRPHRRARAVGLLALGVALLAGAREGSAQGLPAGAAAAGAVAASVGTSGPAGATPDAPPAPISAERAALQADVLRMVQATGRNSEWGVLAVSLESGDTLLSIDPDRTLSPASNQKLLVTAAALHHLGPDYPFPTYLLAEGSVRDGVLEGNVVLYGTGDPSISDRHFRSATDPLRDLARALVAEGIHTVVGAVIGDGTFFEGPTRRDDWPGTDNWYAAAVSALTFNENVMTLQVAAGAAGEPARLLVEPRGPELEVINRSRTVAANPGRRLFLIRDDPYDPIQLRGDMVVGEPSIWREITVADPIEFTASVFQRILEEEGVRVLGGHVAVDAADRSAVTGARTVAPGFAGAAPPVRTIAVHYSPPLVDLIGVMNRVSHNLYAELLLFTVGRVVRGDGSFDGGTQALEEYLVRVAGVRAGDVRVEDGSGLSRRNQATPSAFVRLLTHVAESEYADAFWGSLPRAGNRLELARMYQTPAAGNLRAKTGTIRRVSALSGVVRTRDGEAVLFSIVSNGVSSTSTAKWIEDQIGVRLASWVRDVPPPADRVALVEYGENGPKVLPRP